jgi:hypothetical protein
MQFRYVTTDLLQQRQHYQRGDDEGDKRRYYQY